MKRLIIVTGLTVVTTGTSGCCGCFRQFFSGLMGQSNCNVYPSGMDEMIPYAAPAPMVRSEMIPAPVIQQQPTT